MSIATQEPLVSIGMPTYNRASDMRRALQSVLAQDYTNLELVISDNASTDETQALCEEFARQDSRIRYTRQAVNRGAAANFEEVVYQARGEFYLWLGDDDWIDPAYVSQCVAFFQAHPEYTLVGGVAKYFNAGGWHHNEDAMTLDQEDSAKRVVTYYRRVAENGIFYGLMRREQLMQLPLRNTLGGDWLLVASMAACGRVKTLEDVAVHRAMGGTSDSLESVVRNSGLSKFQALKPSWSIAWSVFREILCGVAAPQLGGIWKRLRLGWRCALIVHHKFIFVDRFSFTLWLAKVRPRSGLVVRLRRLMKASD